MYNFYGVMLRSNRLSVSRLVSLRFASQYVRSYRFDISLSDKFNEYVESNLRSDNPYVTQKPLQKHINYLIHMFSLPLYLRNMFSSKEFAVTILRNVPVDLRLPVTPHDDFTPKDKSFVSEYALLTLAASFNIQLISGKNEKNNLLFHNVSPQIGKEQEISSRGSKATFDWHTENAHEISRPDALLLHCLRGDPQAKTEFIILEDILAKLPKYTHYTSICEHWGV